MNINVQTCTFLPFLSTFLCPYLTHYSLLSVSVYALSVCYLLICYLTTSYLCYLRSLRSLSTLYLPSLLRSLHDSLFAVYTEKEYHDQQVAQCHSVTAGHGMVTCQGSPEFDTYFLISGGHAGATLGPRALRGLPLGPSHTSTGPVPALPWPRAPLRAPAAQSVGVATL